MSTTICDRKYKDETFHITGNTDIHDLKQIAKFYRLHGFEEKHYQLKRILSGRKKNAFTVTCKRCVESGKFYAIM